MESLCGTYRNAIGDSFAKETIRLCREVFLSDDMKSDIKLQLSVQTDLSSYAYKDLISINGISKTFPVFGHIGKKGQ